MLKKKKKKLFQNFLTMSIPSAKLLQSRFFFQRILQNLAQKGYGNKGVFPGKKLHTSQISRQCFDKTRKKIEEKLKRTLLLEH